MKNSFQTFRSFRQKLLSDAQLQEDLQRDPVGTIQRLEQSPLTTDRWIYRIVVSALGLAVISIVLGTIVLIAMGSVSEDKNIPTIITAIGSGAIGALAGLLSRPPANGEADPD
jgi:hypothetical protein